MAEYKTFQKNIRFNKENREIIINKLNKRDKSMYPLEGDWINHLIVEAVESEESVSVEDPYYLEKICQKRCLIKHGRYYICSRGGSFKDEKTIVKKPYIFRIGKEPISFEGIKEICTGCFNFGKGLEDTEFDEICCQNKLIKEEDGFVCIRGGPTDGKSTAKNPYKFRIGKHMMPLDIVRRICNSACYYTYSYEY